MISKLSISLLHDIAIYFGFIQIETVCNDSKMLSLSLPFRRHNFTKFNNTNKTITLPQALDMLADCLEINLICDQTESLQQETIKLVRHLVIYHDTLLLTSTEINQLTALLKQIKEKNSLTAEGLAWQEAIKPAVQVLIHSYQQALLQKKCFDNAISAISYQNPLQPQSH